MMKTELFLIRHGQPKLKDALLGSTDSPLSDLGWSQLNQASTQLKNIDYLVSSPLCRCSSFAQQYAIDNNQELVVDENWRECHFGDWDGLTYDNLYKLYPKLSEAFFDDPHRNMPPNAEKLLSFSLRIENTLIKLLEHQKGKRIAIYTHAGVIRTLIAWCLKIDYSSGLQFRRFAIDYASISQIAIYHCKDSKMTDKEQLHPKLISLNQCL